MEVQLEYQAVLQEVNYWLSTLPSSDNVHYATLLAPLDEGCVLANVWSVEHLVARGVHRVHAVRLIAYRDQARLRTPAGKPLEDWDTKDVSNWFDTLPADLALHASVLAHDEGCVLAGVWSLEYLVRRGLPPDDAARLVAYRDKVARLTSRILVSSYVTFADERGTGGASTSRLSNAAVGAAASVTAVPNSLAAATAAAAIPASVAPSPAAVTLAAECLIAAGDDEVPFKQSTQAESTQADEVQLDVDLEAPANESGKGKKLKALAKQGVAVARVVLERVGPALPFGGAEAANLILQVLDAVEAAVANAANLRQLAERALTVMDVLQAYAEQLRGLQRRRRQDGDRGDGCRKIVSRFQDHLRGILGYAREYASRNCLVRLFTSAGDSERFQEYVEELRRLGEDLRMLLAVDSNARLHAVQASMAASLAVLSEQRVAYQDPAAEARALVTQLGGMDAVLADAGKLCAVMQKMDVSARITIDVVSSLLRSHLDRGPQRHIQQPELRLFWAHHFGDLPEVPWFVFWDCFPSLLAQLPGSPFDAGAVAELGRLLGDQAAQAAFQRAVERRKADTVSVWELRLSFRADDALVPQIAELLGSRSSGQSGKGDWGGGDADTSASRDGGGAALSAASAGGRAWERCQLPPLPLAYQGRDEEAAEIMTDLTGTASAHRGSGPSSSNGGCSTCSSQGGGSSVLLLAEGGMGKSCLAADVGWRLLRAGKAPGGVLWVDLREADSPEEVEARFCAAVGLQREPAAVSNVPRVVAALKRMAADGSQQQQQGQQGQQQGQQPATGAGVGPGPPTADGVGLAGSATARAETTAASATGSEAAVTTAVTAPIGAAMRLLLVVDNAEDALVRQEAARTLRGVITGVIAQVACARLLVTSRSQLQEPDSSSGADATQQVADADAALAGLVVRPVGTISPAAAAGVVRALVQGLPEVELAQVAAVCRCVPLVLRVVADALNCGRLTLTELVELQTRQTTAPAASGDDHDTAEEPAGAGSLAAARVTAGGGDGRSAGAAGALVGVVLASLGARHRQAAAQLAVLPTTFDEELAAAVLGLEVPGQAYGLLATLVRHSVLQRGVGGGDGAGSGGGGGQTRYIMHMLVRREAARLEEEAHAAASGRYVCHVLCKLREWGDMYAQGREWQLALAAGRDLAVDVSAAAELLPGAPDPAAAAEMLTPGVAGLLAALGVLARFEAPLQALCERLALEPAAAAAAGNAGSDAGTSSGEAATARATAAVLFVLSCARLAGGGHGPAEEAARGAVGLQQSALGPEHPHTLASRDQLAACLQAQGLFAAAESAFRQAFELRRRVLGAAHPDTLASMGHLAACLRALGRHAEAEPVFRRTLELQLAVLGPEHPHTLASISSLAGFLRSRCQFAEAEPLYRQALALRERVLGSDHRDTVGSVNALANCLRSLGRHEDAEPRYRAVRAWREQWLGAEHPDTLTVLNNLASCLQKLCRYQEAEDLFRKVLEARKRVLKPKAPQAMHPHTVFSLSNLACCIRDAGRPGEAEPLLREALALRTACQDVGPSHADTAISVALLAACLRDLGREAEAEEVELQAAS